MSQETHVSGALARHLPTFVIVLMAIQPLMDILSFWTDRLGMSNTITLPTMLPVKEAAARFGLSPYFLRSLCHTGQVRYIAVSKNRWLVNAESVAEFCKGCPAESQPDTVQGVRRVTL